MAACFAPDEGQASSELATDEQDAPSGEDGAAGKNRSSYLACISMATVLNVLQRLSEIHSGTSLGSIYREALEDVRDFKHDYDTYGMKYPSMALDYLEDAQQDVARAQARAEPSDPFEEADLTTLVVALREWGKQLTPPNRR